MISFPNAKINLGLNILSRRNDGYHNIDTVMVGVDWTDILEIVPSASSATTLSTSGRNVDCPPEKNLVIKALKALEGHLGTTLPPVDIYLEKNIPDGAGLGGGSSDAASTLLVLNKLFTLGLDHRQLAEIAAKVGADCPFFIYNKPAHCTGTGTTLNHISLDALDHKAILIAKPAVAAVSTREAYAGVVPYPSATTATEILKEPIERWQGSLKNDFEISVFPLLPDVAEVKTSMMNSGAEYCAMSGSGAAVFGIFDNDNMAHVAMQKLHDCEARVCHICR